MSWYLESVVGLVYHDSMTIPRQAPASSTTTGGGRVNQKQRTRQALVDAAVELMDDGTTPTVAQAAEAALVSRTTAYRYFPTQESLLLEVALHANVDDLEALVAEPVDAQHAVERALEVLHRFNERVLAEEVRYRNAMRVYQELWFDASAAWATVGAVPSSMSSTAASTIAWRVRCFWLVRPPPSTGSREGP
jgi:AcrR family transcriptional regulator